jgi:phosphoglycerate dehydrogenase-like enzyme
MTRIALLDDYQNVALKMASWESIDAEVVAFTDHLNDEDALAARLEPFEIVMAMRERTPFSSNLMARLFNLQLLVTSGMRNASIDLTAANELGITVCGTLGEPHATAELTWGLILALARQIPKENAATQSGAWQLTIGSGLANKTLGVIGLGRLGSQVARVGNSFSMNVVAWSANLTDERAAEVGVTRVDKNTLLETSDFVTIHLVLSDRTHGLINTTDLDRMKSTAYLVNTSRGPIIDETSLITALENGTIAGAGLDVFDIEPLPPEHPLLKMPNTVITPHLGYVTRETYALFYGGALEAIKAYLNGDPIRVLKP